MSAKTSKKKKRTLNIIAHNIVVTIDQYRKYFKREKETKQRHLLQQPVERTAECFDITSRTILNIRKCLEDGEPFNDEDERDCDMNISEMFVGVIREAISTMYASKERVTLDLLQRKLTDQVSTRSTAWKWSRSTFHRFLANKMGYIYDKRRPYYQELKEDVAIAAQCVAYIRQIQQCRAESRAIFYQDETWLNKNMTPAKVWLDKEGKGGLKIPQGKEERCIICCNGITSVTCISLVNIPHFNQLHDTLHSKC